MFKRIGHKTKFFVGNPVFNTTFKRMYLNQTYDG